MTLISPSYKTSIFTANEKVKIDNILKNKETDENVFVEFEKKCFLKNATFELAESLVLYSKTAPFNRCCYLNW